MPTWKKNIFVRVVRARMERESKTVDEILNSYTSLTDIEKQEIKNSI